MEKQPSMWDQTIVDTAFKTDGKICPKCQHTELSRITTDPQSNIACTLCGAVYYHPDHYDVKRAGYFAGQYLEMPAEKVYELNNKFREQSQKENN